MFGKSFLVLSVLFPSTLAFTMSDAKFVSDFNAALERRPSSLSDFVSHELLKALAQTGLKIVVFERPVDVAWRRVFVGFSEPSRYSNDLTSAVDKLIKLPKPYTVEEFDKLATDTAQSICDVVVQRCDPSDTVLHGHTSVIMYSAEKEPEFAFNLVYCYYPTPQADLDDNPKQRSVTRFG
jgi:hypothetical protein